MSSHRRSFQFHGQLLSLVFFFIICLLLSSCSTASSARLLLSKQGEEKVVNTVPDQIGHHIAEIEQDQDSLTLMGMELCENEDEECFKRRMIAEAHLDYIYTQHHKP